MDDIYDNLENYENVNDVTELKNENKELKQKLEEYSGAMNQLQKDFEKLNSEYKKLELNYSSLLKTARAEIERKGEIIKNLNTEKDKLIINALQTKGKRVYSNNFNENQKFSKDQNNYGNTDKAKQKQNCVETKDKVSAYKNNRLETGPSISISSNANENKPNTNTTSVDKLLNIDKHPVTNTEIKGNTSKYVHKDDIPSNKDSSSQRISNRRKSMPAASFQEAKFSSDEETDKSYSKNNRKSPPKNLRPDNRDYRTEIHSHGSTDSSRSRNSNMYDCNTQRHNDYDIKRYHRKYSPERYQHRHSDYNRQRVLKSPPTDKYNRSKSRDRRYNYEKEPYHDRHRHHEHSTLKHKLRNHFDEPSSKRQKTELYTKCPSQDSNYISDREKEFSDRRYIAEPEFEQISCQSPDYINSDHHFPQHLIKEIRHIAATSLEDPRISSKKYILQSHNDQNFLLIPSARNIDFPCIDKVAWGLENVKLPEDLKRIPCSVSESEKYLNQIYDNIDDNESFESGEIQSLEDDVILSKAPENLHEQNLHFNTKNVSSNTTDTGQKISKPEVRQNSSTGRYKIPKVKKDQECSNDMKHNTKVSDNISEDRKKGTESNFKLKESDKKSKPNEFKHNQVLENVQTSVKLEKANNNNKQTNMDKAIQDKIRTVEGDLELSDEESDSMEFHKEIEESVVTSESSQNTCTTTIVNEPCANTISVEKKDTVGEKPLVEKNTTENIVTKETSTNKKSSSKDPSRDSKKRRSKNKSESKETTSKDQKDIKDKKKSNDKNNKKSIPEQETANKFNDLFCEANSLITPDDLGIPATDSNIQDIKYASLFENTPDTMDLNVQNVHNAGVSQPTEQLATNTNFNTMTATLPNKEKNEADQFLNANISNNKSKKSDKNQHLNEKVNVETPMDSNDVVKTCIISTGVQPRRDDNNLPETPAINLKSNNEKDTLSKVNALATSTPYKPIVNNDKMITSQDSDTINSSNVSLGLNNSSSFIINSNQTEDVPDVRIIVRRKRKVIRKPT